MAESEEELKRLLMKLKQNERKTWLKILHSCIEPGPMILDAWGWCTETTQRDGTGREGGSGTRVYLWRIHVDVWQNQYNIVK